MVSNQNGVGTESSRNRSILGSRKKDMKNILNLKIKKRESFRPFAPSILKEHIHDWFEVPKNDYDSLYDESV